MTPSIVLAGNTAPPTTAPAATASTPSGSSNNNHDDFTRPLREARQQQAASSGSPPRTAASTSSSPKGRTSWSPYASNDQSKDDSKKTQSQPVDATTAMLALLGQSVPAMTTSTAAPATPAGSSVAADAAATGSSAAGAQAATMPGLIPGMMPSGTAIAAGQSASDEAGDDLSALGGVKDNALTTAAGAGDASDDLITALATAVTASAKADPTGQAVSTPATQNDHDPIDALRALTAAQIMQPPVAAQAAAPAHALSLNAPVGSPSFGQELGQQVAWLGGQDIKQARIRLNPEELGPLDVKVSVLHDHVDVSFIVQHPQAVHAVQQTLSQLDAMLAHHGLTLGQAQVGQGGAGSHAGQGAPSGSATDDEAESADGGAVASVGAAVMSAVGLLDTFA